MNLIIDQGNTITKIAVFDKNVILEKFLFSELNIETLSELQNNYDIRYVIMSTVRNNGEETEMFLKQIFPIVYRLNHNTILPFEIAYKTPSTLGADRIAAVAGALAEIKDKPLIVIDAGTAITYDFVDDKKIYRGGNIAPGINMRFRSLNEFTGKLPLVEKEGDIPQYGDTTITALRCGVVKGVVYEIVGFINDVKEKYPEVFVFLTGGDSFFLAKNIKYPTFVDENLVLKGLNRILNYNVEK